MMINPNFINLGWFQLYFEWIVIIIVVGLSIYTVKKYDGGINK